MATCYVSLLMLCACSFAGCMNLDPLDTQVHFRLEDGRQLKYASQKDVSIFVKRENPKTGELETILEFESKASPAAAAQVKRDRVEAEANARVLSFFESAFKAAAEAAGGGVVTP